MRRTQTEQCRSIALYRTTSCFLLLKKVGGWRQVVETDQFLGERKEGQREFHSIKLVSISSQVKIRSFVVRHSTDKDLLALHSYTLIQKSSG
jgi:hypothetical protein